MQPGQADFAPEGYAQYWNSAEKKGYSGHCDFHPKAAAVGADGALAWRSTTTRARVIALEFDRFFLVNRLHAQ